MATDKRTSGDRTGRTSDDSWPISGRKAERAVPRPKIRDVGGVHIPSDVGRKQLTEPLSKEYIPVRVEPPGISRKTEGNLQRLPKQTDERIADPADRIAGYTRLIERNPTLSTAFVQRGEAYFAKGDYRRAIEDFIEATLIANGTPKAERLAIVTRTAHTICPVSRPLWRDRSKHEQLSHLTAPRFLRAVYPDALDAEGRLINEDLVRLSDPELVRAVQGHINERTQLGLSLGDAAGLIFERRDRRGRPKTRAKKRPSPSPR